MTIAAITSNPTSAAREFALAAAAEPRAAARRHDLPQPIDAPATAVEAAPEVPPQPRPLTTTTAALHLMQVPSSHLLEAFSALRQALGEQSSASSAATPRSELAAFLARLPKEVAADSTAALPAGSVLDLSA